MKKIIFVFLTAMMIGMVLPLSICAEYKDEDYTYTVSNGKATIIEYTGYESDIVIPEYLSGYPVTKIGYRAFDYKYMDSVVFPEGLTNIGELAFNRCHNLQQITLPSSLIHIDKGAFEGCESLEIIHIKDLGSWCELELENHALGYFADQKWILNIDGEILTEEIIPDGTTKIHKTAFDRCDKLTHITIPNSVTSIPSHLFSHLPSVTIHCEEGSAAHAYAMRLNIPFVIENFSAETTNDAQFDTTINSENISTNNDSSMVICLVVAVSAFLVGVGATILVMKMRRE